MIQNVLNRIGGIEVYGEISLCLFIAVFCGACAWAFSLERSTLHETSRLPLEDGTVQNPTPTGGPRHE